MWVVYDDTFYNCGMPDNTPGMVPEKASAIKLSLNLQSIEPVVEIPGTIEPLVIVALIWGRVLLKFFLIGKTIFLIDFIIFLIGKTIFLIDFIVFPFGKIILLIGVDVFPIDFIVPTIDDDIFPMVFMQHRWEKLQRRTEKLFFSSEKL